MILVAWLTGIAWSFNRNVQDYNLQTINKMAMIEQYTLLNTIQCEHGINTREFFQMNFHLP